MAYLLKNRALPEDFDDESYAPCIFCGEMLSHFNGGGRGMVVNSCEEGETRAYLYCHTYKCPQRVADELYEHSMWFCGCEADYIDVIGEKCPACSTSSDKPVDICGEAQKREYVYTLELHTTKRVNASSVVHLFDTTCLEGAVSLVSSEPHVAYKKE